MKHLHLTLGYLREQRAQIDAAIATLETLLGGRGGGNGNGHAGTLTAAAAALAQHGAAPGRPGAPRGVPRPRTGQHTHEAKLERRKRSLAILEQFDRAEPRRAQGGRGQAVMPLLRHGYLKRKGDGYVRTAKEFVP